MGFVEKIRKTLTPKRMQKVNAAGAVFNLFAAIVAIFIGLPSEIVQIFLASGFCFVAGGLANWYMAKTETQKDV